MTGYEKMAYEFGKSFIPEDGTKDGVCYDPRMKNLVCEARSEAGRLYNQRNMLAWWKGRKDAGACVPDFVKELKQSGS